MDSTSGWAQTVHLPDMLHHYLQFADAVHHAETLQSWTPTVMLDVSYISTRLNLGRSSGQQDLEVAEGRLFALSNYLKTLNWV